MQPWAELRKLFRFLLRNKPAEIGSASLFAVGLAMIYGGDFRLGIVALTLTAAWGIVAWLLSDELQKRKPQLPKKQRFEQIQKYKHARKRYLFWKFSIPLGALILLLLSAWFVDRKREQEMLSEFEGFLLPMDDPDPVSFCRPTNIDALKIFVGPNEVYSSKFPFVVLRVYGKDRVVVDRDSDGRIALTVDIFDQQGKLIVSFEKGHFAVVQTNILDMKRPNRGTLIVRDQYKNQVLDVRYLNKRSLQISGLLRYPEVGAIPIEMTPLVSRVCAGEASVAFDIEPPQK